MLRNSVVRGSFIPSGTSANQPSLLQSIMPVISAPSVCDSLNDKINELIDSLQETECDEIAKMKCAINKNTDRLEDLACAVGGGCNDLKMELIKYEKLYEKIFSAIDNYLIYFRVLYL